MEVIVKSSPKIEIELATKVVKVGGKVTVDSALSTESENPVMNKIITEELNTLNESILENGEKISALDKKKADKEGNFPLLHVGTADDLAGRGESVPAEFGFRASGGKSIKDGRAYIKRIKGNSVVWNQLSSAETLGNGVAIRPLPLGATIVEGNKYLILCDLECSLYLYYNKGEGNKSVTSIYNKSSLFFTSSVSCTSNGKHSVEGGLWWYLAAAKDTPFHARLIDLTKAFPNDWQNINTIEDFYRLLPTNIDINAYNEGQVIHCNTESIKSVGDNAWDEEWELGNYNINTGEPSTGTYVRSKSDKPIKVLPNTEYYIYNGSAIGQSDIGGYMSVIFFYDSDDNFIKRTMSIANAIFTTPQNCDHIRFYNNKEYGTTYNHDIMITLVHSGWKQDTDAGYQPYWQDILPLPIIGKYFPQGMKSAGSAHDEVRYNKASGKWEAVQRIGSVDMGTLIWNYIGVSDSNPYGRLSASLPSRKIGKGNLLCSVYSSKGPSYSTDKNIFGAGSAATIIVIDSAYTDAATFKADMAGVMLYYESNDWEWVELDAEDQNFRDYYNVADFGTEMSQSSVPSAPFSADIIYQFNAVDMIREHEIEITELQSIITEQQSVIATMQAQLTSLINGGQ